MLLSCLAFFAHLPYITSAFLYLDADIDLIFYIVECCIALVLGCVSDEVYITIATA